MLTHVGETADSVRDIARGTAIDGVLLAGPNVVTNLLTFWGSCPRYVLSHSSCVKSVN